MESESSICNIANDINNEVKEILTKYLSPHLAQMNQDRMNMKCIENILRGMPEFQRLEKENIELRRQLEVKESQPVSLAPAYEPAALVLEPATLVLEPAALVPDSIKFDIIESPIVEDNVTNELELYKVADLLHIANNEASDEVEASEADASEADASEADEEAEQETEAEEEASEAEQTEEEASEAEEAEEEAEASEAEEEEVEEVEASEAEEEEAEDEQEASEAEEEVEEEEAEEEAEETSEAEQEAEEEVSLIVINGISYYTTNETSGDIYKVEGTDDVGDQVGKFVNKIATFF